MSNLKEILDESIEASNFALKIDEFLLHNSEFKEADILDQVAGVPGYVLAIDNSTIYARDFIVEELRFRIYKQVSEVIRDNKKTDFDVISFATNYKIDPKVLFSILSEVYDGVILFIMNHISI